MDGAKRLFLTGVYHPSALLLDPSKMAETKEDFQRIREKLDTFL